MKRAGPYVLQELIAKCSCGEVYKSVSANDNALYAVKMLKKNSMSQEEVDYYENELTILQALQHANIVRLCDIKKSTNHYYIVLEYYEGCTLENYVDEKGRLEENVAREILKQIVGALNELYKLSGTHRNLKLSKVLLTNINSTYPTVKLTGFGRAQLGKDSKGYCGDLVNVGPEIRYGKSYSRSADIWSLGSIVYQVLTGMQMISTKNKYKLSTSVPLSTEAIDFISNTTQRNPGKRMIWEDLVEHPFIASDKVTEFDFDRFANEYLLLKDSLNFIELDSDTQYDLTKFPLFEGVQSLKLQSLESSEEKKKAIETPSNLLNSDCIPVPSQNKDWLNSGSWGAGTKRSIVQSIKDNWIKDPVLKKPALESEEFISKPKKHKEESSENLINEGDFEILVLDSSSKSIKNVGKRVKEAERDFSVKIEGNIDIAEEHFK